VTMFRTVMPFIMICGSLLFFSCSSTPDASSSWPRSEPDEFWKYITRKNDYTQWSHWPGYEEKYPGTTPRGAWIELYANEAAIEAVKAGKDIMPYGAILVKENYARDKETLLSVTPMYKAKGYNSKGNDWFWAEYDPEGRPRARGRVQSCMRCHEASVKDFRFTQPR
jgi:hypothetical protein